MTELLGKLDDGQIEEFLTATEQRRQDCLDEVQKQDQHAGRMWAWGMHGATTIRNDVPMLIALIRNLMKKGD